MLRTTLPPTEEEDSDATSQLAFFDTGRPPMRHYPPKAEGGHTGWSPWRDRSAQRRFEQALIKRSGGLCEWPGCKTPTFDTQAHHDRAGYTADCGRYLCLRHHKRVDPHARATGRKRVPA